MSFMDKVRLVIKPELASKKSRIMLGTVSGAGLGGILGVPIGMKLGANSVERSVQRAIHGLKPDGPKAKFIKAMHILPGIGAVMAGMIEGGAAGIPAGAILGGTAGYAVDRYAVAKARELQRKVITGLSTAGGIGALGTGAYILNKRNT